MLEQKYTKVVAMDKYVPLYLFSLKEAKEYEEVDKWRKSHSANCDCARTIERAIRDNYKNNVLEKCINDIVKAYGLDRVNWVLANTIQQNKTDGRFSEDNKKWAKDIWIPREEHCWQFVVDSHPGLVDLFVNQARAYYKDLGLFDSSHCTDEKDYAGKVLVITPRTLKDEYKTADFQLFFATSGFGCDPRAIGSQVNGYFLKDDEFTHFRRQNFFGVIDEQYLPEWAKEKLAEHQSQNNEDVGMGGLQ